MAEQDLKQVMLDAITDADSLEQFINGDDTQDVLTRLSAEYPTLQKAIKQMFENGGLPATPFATKVLMESSELIDGAYAVVTEDDDANNGLYIKDGADWIKSKYDVLNSFLRKMRDNAEVQKSDIYTSDANKNIYSSNTDATGLYIEVAGRITSSSQGASINRFSVKKGQVVTFNVTDAANLNPSYGNNQGLTVGVNVTPTLEPSKNGMVSVVVPNDVTHVYINTYIRARGFDVRESLVVNIIEPSITDIDGMPLADVESREMIAKIPNTTEYDSTSHLFVKKDSLDNIIEYTDHNGDLYLTGLKGSIQENLNAVTKSLSGFDGAIAYTNSKPVYTFKDADDNTVATINTDGGLYVGGLYGSVQDNIKLLQHDVNSIYNILKQKELKGAYGLEREDYTANSSEVLAATAQEGTVQTLIVDSPYNKNDDFVHPDVIELKEPLRGYRYLMCINPYYNATITRENPVVYGSNDKTNWEMLRGFYQPLDEPPQVKNPNSPRDGYLSDNWFSYDPINKELLCCYRYNTSNKGVIYGSTDTVELFYRKTKDGLNWSDRTQLYPQSTMNINKMVSPVMFYDESIGKWVMLYQQAVDKGLVVTFNDTLDPDTWSEPVSTGVTEFYNSAGGLNLWHMGGKFIGQDFYLMLGIDADKHYPVFAKANDNTYTDWSCSVKNVFGDIDKRIYKGAFLPELVDGGVRLQYFWTESWTKLLTATSNTISINQ